MSEKTFRLTDLDGAVAAGILPAPTAAALAQYLETSARPAPAAAPRPRFDLTHLLWYAGALIIMSAMGLFSTLAFGMMGGTGLTITGLLYFLGLWGAGHRLWQNPDSQTPGGLLIAAAIAMVPMIVFGLQQASGTWAGFENPGAYRGFYDYIKGGWLMMEIATLAVSLFFARRYPFTFIAFPAAITLWFMSMDLAAWAAGADALAFTLRRQVSLWFGIITFFAVWIYELRPRKADFAFWLHLVAATTFWGGVTFQSSSSELGKLLYCLLSIALLGVAVFMGRRIYAVYGVIGVMIYLGYLTSKVFANSVLFPFVLSGVGIALVALGLWMARNRARLANAVERVIPAELMALRPVPARNPAP